MAGVEKEQEGSGEEDYMGDLSLFIPPEDLAISSKKVLESNTQQSQKPKRSKSVPWQEKRRIDREMKQKEEDDLTKLNMETRIPSSNVGFKMLKLMGYSPGSALGKEGKGVAEPVELEIRRSRAGIGRESEIEERLRKQKESEGRFNEDAESKRRRVEGMMMEFGARQKTQWRSKRVVWDFRKAEAALAQLENREVVDEEKKDDEQEEEEEKEITEEDLLTILMKLREEHRYCLYCGFQYESLESLETSCPGINEDDH